MQNRPQTEHRRPLPARPPDGLTAWQTTLGYISTHYGPDAMLKVQAYPVEDKILWSAAVSWGTEQETVRDYDGIGPALAALWLEVDQHQTIFTEPSERVKAPQYYKDDEWLDDATEEILQRVIKTTATVFADDWLVIIVYQPTETPTMRVQMRLLANENALRVGGRGPTILRAARDLFRNAAPAYAHHAGLGSISQDE